VPAIQLVISKLDWLPENRPTQTNSVTASLQIDEESVVATTVVVDRSRALGRGCSQVAVEGTEEERNKGSAAPASEASSPLARSQTSPYALRAPKPRADYVAARAPHTAMGRFQLSLHWFRGAAPSAVVLFLHGSGDQAEIFREWVNETWSGRLVSETPAAFVFPDSGVSPESGRRVWFDTVTETVPPSASPLEDGHDAASEQWSQFREVSSEDLDEMCLAVDHMLQEIIQRGTRPEHVFLAGFSNGGAAALHAGLRTRLPIGGVVCLSGAFGVGSATFQHLAASPSPPTIPVLMCHGKEDELVPVAAGKATAKRLAELGVPVDMQTFGRLRHGVAKSPAPGN